MKIFHCVSLTPLCQITRSGEFVLPLDSFHKKPYEVLILGRVQGSVKEALRYARQWYKSLFEAAVSLLVRCLFIIQYYVPKSPFDIIFWMALG